MPEECSSNKMVSLDFLDREAALYKQSKETLKTNGEIIDKVIKKNNQTIFFFDLAIYLNFLSMAISPEPRRKIANVITPHIKGYS